MDKLLPSLRRNALLQALALCVLFPSFVMLPSTVRANPEGGVVVSGAIEILQGEDFDPAFLEILQSSDKGIINWQDFNIGEGETTRFSVPGVTSATLNRVMSGNPSAIYGNLISNGKLLLINQNGIVVGPGGVVDAFGGFIGSTLDISDGDFLNGGDDVFMGASAAGITNFGTIVSGGGDVILLGNFIDNQGTIGAVDGTIALGAGGDILVSQVGEAKISIRAAGPGGNIGINNAGEIRGGAVELKAHGNVYAQAINNSGMVRASGATTNANGRVILSARGTDGSGGSVVNTGEIRANNADGSGGFILADAGGSGGVLNIDGVVNANGLNNTPGGSITLLGETIGLGSNARVSADGTEGGVIIIGSADETIGITGAAGSRVSANGSVGNGGTVIISGNNDSVLSLNGTIEARGAATGGFISATGGSVSVGSTGIMDASGGVDGGFVSLEATNGVATINGTVLADGATGNGGFVSVTGSDGVIVGPTGLISASGEVNGGTVLIEATDGEATINGTVNANGATGNGGVINVDGEGGVSIGSEASINANGGVEGGLIDIDSGADTYVAGAISATGGSGVGGRVNVSGENVIMAAGSASVNVDGGAGGGKIAVGGSFQGKDDPDVRNSQSTQVGRGVTLSANALNSGDAGRVVVWSDGDTIFNGDILAQGRGEIGNGGLVEVSGKRNLTFRGTIDATSVNGHNGNVLFDPGDVEIGNGGTADIFTATLNTLLQGGTNVIVATDNSDGMSGSILLRYNGEQDDRNDSIQWNTDADFGLFAAGNLTILTNVRNAGSGSVNLIAGWGGLETELPGLTFLDNPGGDPHDFTGTMDVEDIFDLYVAADQYGENGGTIFLNDITNNTSVIVGSRYGETNVAAQNLIMQAGNSSTRRLTHLGFYDWGAVFDSSATMFGTSHTDFLQVGAAAGDALVAGSGAPVVTQGGQDGVNLYYYADVPLTGYTDDPSTDGLGAILTDGFVPFSDHWQRIDLGNYWWRRLTDTTDGLGNNLPENGAGSAAVQADINVILKGSLIMTTDNDDGDVMIGHGGLASHGSDTRSWGRTRNDGDQGHVGTERSINMVHNDNDFSGGIARLAPIYGDINISAGGLVQLNGGTNRGLQIGHLGNYQTGGEVHGDITVAAGADVSLQAGGGWNGHATIGHHMNGGETGNDSRAQAATIAWYNEGDGASFEAEETNPLKGPDVWTNLVGDISVTSRFGSVTLRGATAGTGSGANIGNTADPINPIGTDANEDAVLTDGIGIDWNQNGFGRGGRSAAQIGHGGNDVASTRRSNFIGDITVLAGVEGAPGATTVNNAFAKVDLEAGSRVRNFALIGHGGYNSSYEGLRSGVADGAGGSDYTAGDIRVEAGGDVRVSGSTTVASYPMTRLDNPPNANRGNVVTAVETMQAFAQIGHGGIESDNQFTNGDILVNAGGDVDITAGAYRWSYGQIGHGGVASRGQIGDAYTRTHDGVVFTDTGTTGGAAVFQTGVELVLENQFGDAFGNLLTDVPGGDTTADIRVLAGGAVSLRHLDEDDGFYEHGANNPQELFDDPLHTDPLTPALQMTSGEYGVYESYALIGHGGRDTGFNEVDAIAAFDEKTGNIEVRAVGDVTMENGTGQFFSTHIGHTDQIERFSNGDDSDGNAREMVMTGDITVASSTGSVILNADHANPTRTENLVVTRDNGNSIHGAVIDISPSADPLDQIPIYYNPVRIGHGGVWNNRRIVAVGNISVDAAADISLLAGKARYASVAQIGHGTTDPEGNEGLANESLTGDINVYAGGNISLTANPNSAIVDPSNSPNAFDVEGAAAYIGHGGVGLDGTKSGTIDVTAVGNLTMTSTQRTQIDIDTGTGPAASILGFTQIGHVAPREQNTIQANTTGNITVQVGGNLTMLGGTTVGSNDISGVANPAQPVVLAYSQIGHGGPDVDGIKEGDIDITVGGDFTATGGSSPETDGKVDGLNYVMVGNGDWDRVPFTLPSSGQLNSGTGQRGGDITVKVGESAFLTQVLVGHADFNTLPSVGAIATGNTFFGVSRNNPFQSTGTGVFDVSGESVFSSAFYGFGSELRIYVPKRELNLMSQDTTLNFTQYASGTPGETGSGTGGISWVAPFPVAGELSGRGDEVYLNPDLWLMASASGGVDFVPGDPTMQGSVAAVADPGDIGNLTGLTDNAQLGTGTGTYLGGNGLVNGITNYTIYYDAIGAFVPSVPGGSSPGGGSSIIPPVIPFIPTVEDPIVIEVPFDPFALLPFLDLISFQQATRSIRSGFAYEQSGRTNINGLDNLIEGDAVDSGGGVAGSQTDGSTKEEDDEDKRRANYQRQKDNWNTYYQYSLGGGEYTSFKLFAAP